MPIYEYICSSCDHEFEELARSMSDEKVPNCPNCDGGSVVRKLSVFAARQGEAPSAGMPPGCGRCGDPNGSCPMMG